MQPGMKVNQPKIPQRMLPFAIPVSKEIYEQMEGISTNRKKKIENMANRNIPSWKRWIMKRYFKIGKLFAYVMKIEGKTTKKGEIVRERITLMCREKKLDSIIFIAKQDDGPDLYALLPKEKYPSKTPGYIG